MNHIKVGIFLLILASIPALAFNPDRQVLVNGRVATFGSVVVYCDGDTLKASQLSIELPVKAPYLTKQRVAMEKLYNSLNPDYIAVGLAFLCLILILTRRRTIVEVAFFCLTLALIYGFVLRWYIGDGIPLTTVTDTTTVIALGLCVALMVSFRDISYKTFAIVALLVIILALPSAILGEHPSVRVVNTSLKSIWLMIHVPLIIASYSIFLLSAVMAITDKVGKKLFILLIAGEVLLVSGIICGSLWASEAWNRYWGWDPKEVAALLTALVYISVIFTWKAAMKRIIYRRIIVAGAFLFVIFTCFFISSGLHAY